LFIILANGINLYLIALAIVKYLRDRFLDDFVKNKDQVLKDLFSFLEIDDSYTTTQVVREAVSGVPKNKAVYEFIYKPNPIKSIITSVIKPIKKKKVRVNLWKQAVNT